MVVGKATLDEILSRLSTVEKNIGRPINPTVYSVEEFKSKLASGNHFLTAVLKGQKEFLLGDEDELRKVGGVRLAKAGATSTGEIKDLLGIVDRSLADSKVEAVSTDLRFIAAFNAALCIATTALRASGLRTVTQAGHHVKTIESLELTIKANPKVIQRFKTFNNKRNKSVYDVAGAVSDQELEAMVKLAEELKNNTLAWLRNLHPELLPAGPSGPTRAGGD